MRSSLSAIMMHPFTPNLCQDSSCLRNEWIASWSPTANKPLRRPLPRAAPPPVSALTRLKSFGLERKTMLSKADLWKAACYANNVLPRSLLQSQLPDPMKLAPLPGMHVLSLGGQCTYYFSKVKEISSQRQCHQTCKWNEWNVYRYPLLIRSRWYIIMTCSYLALIKHTDYQIELKSISKKGSVLLSALAPLQLQSLQTLQLLPHWPTSRRLHSATFHHAAPSFYRIQVRLCVCMFEQTQTQSQTEN